MMRIGIEVRALSRLRSGIGNYTYNLVKNLLEADQENQYFLYTCRNFDESFLKRYHNVTIRKFPFPIGTLWTQTILPFQMISDKLDVFHSPETMVPLFSAAPSIATALDLISFLYPEGHDPKAKMAAWLYPLVFKKSKKLVTISEHTKKDLIELFGVNPDKVEAIPISYDEEFYAPVAETGEVMKKYTIRSLYILNVGVLSPRKNIVRLIEAYNIIQEDTEAALVIAGPKGWQCDEIFDKVKELGLERRVIFTGSMPRGDLPAMYSGASLFVYPSLYEGFGIPVLEAMACKTPVIASNSSSLPEVVGEAGILVDPTDTKKLADAMYKVLADRNLAETYARKGLERVKQFSWKNCAEETLKVYKEVAGQS